MGATSSRLIILLGVLLSVAAIGYGLYKIQTEERAQQAALPAPQPAAVEAPEPPRVVEILAAARPIARGQLVVPADLATIPVVGAAPPGAFTVAEEAIGQTAVVDIAARQLILEQSLSPHPADAGLAAAIPAGYRAVGIRTNAEIAAGNYGKPGDRVDIAIVLAETVVPGGGQAGGGDGRGDLSKANLLLQDVPVLSVGPLLTANPVQASPDGDSAGRRPEVFQEITVAMTPDQIAQFSLARSLGPYFLALRNPEDREIVGPTTAELQDILGPGALGPRTGEMIVAHRTEIITVQTAEGDR